MAGFGSDRGWLRQGVVITALTIGAPCAAQVGEAKAPAPPPASESRGLGDPSAATQVGGPKPGATPGRTDRGWATGATLPLAAVLAVVVVGGVLIRVLARGQGSLRARLGAGGSSPSGIIEVLGRYPVGRGSTLVLLKLDRRVLLLSQSAMGKLGLGSTFTPLCEVTDPDEVASILIKTRDEDGDSMSERFKSLLSRFDGGMDPPPSTDEARRIRTGPGGDRAEIWDTGRDQIPVVDLTKREEPGAVGSLKRRLASIRWPQEGGAA